MNLFCRNAAIFPGSDIQQQIAAVTHYICKNAYHFERSFIICIIRMVTPVIIRCHAQFPPAEFRTGNREILFGGFIVPIALQSAIYNGGGIYFQNGGPYFFCLPFFRAVFPVSVEPPEVGFVSEVYFIDLSLKKMTEPLPARRVICNFVAVAVF